MTLDSESSASTWRLFHATGRPGEGDPPELPPAPPWRRFTGEPLQPDPPEADSDLRRRLGALGDVPYLEDSSVDVVNAALILRRPLLVTGPPGVGKSTLAHLLASELRLGRVLPWPVVSRTTLKEGTYTYDAIGRAQALAAWRAEQEASGTTQEPPRLGDFITLGPLGTALLPHRRPRVLLVDELDKSDLDLPNDLLHVLENGSYEITELTRGAEVQVSVRTDDPDSTAVISRGRVECAEFPIVVITSNGEREFPAAFRRRCLPLEMPVPSRDQLLAMVGAHLQEHPQGIAALTDDFVQRVRSGGAHSIDQLLNALYLISSTSHDVAETSAFSDSEEGRRLVEVLLRDLSKGL